MNMIQGNVSQFELLFKPQALLWKYNFNIRLSVHKIEEKVEDIQPHFTLGLSLLDLGIIVCQSKMLNVLLEKDISLKQWMEIISVKGPKMVQLENEQWVFGANRLHFATKFNSKSLNMIFQHMKKEDKSALIKHTHEDGQFSPLHVAAFLKSPSLWCVLS